jgi:glutathione peroxidase
MRRFLAMTGATALLLALTAAAFAGKAGLLDRSYGRWQARRRSNWTRPTAATSSWWSTPPANAATRRSSKRSRRCTSSTPIADSRVLGFPSGDFKSQEYDDEKQIKEFCTLTYGVKFPMFEKVHVVGEQATPLYRDLAAASGQAPAWNFHKYLIGRDGHLIASWGSKTTPDDKAITDAIERALQAPRPNAPGA